MVGCLVGWFGFSLLVVWFSFCFVGLWIGLRPVAVDSEVVDSEDGCGYMCGLLTCG